MVYHAGPAGSRFHDIEDAGRHMLEVNCNNYPCTANSYILPPLFLSQFPEESDSTTSKLVPRVAPPLNQKEQKKLDGISSGQGGEKTEYKIFHLLTKLFEEEQDIPVLVLRDFELDTKGKGNLKRKTLMSEYPQITSIDMRGQQDCILILKDLGFICIEIKRTLSAESIQKAKDQLDRSESFLNDIMPAITTNFYRLPILKLVMFESDDPQHSNFPGYHFFDCSGDSITAFKLKLRNLKQELQSKLPANPLTSLEFKRLVHLLTGLWSMKSMNRQTYFDVNDASVTHLSTQVDVSLDHAHLSSDATKPKITNNPHYAPVTNVIYNLQGTVFREANEINLMYLTPEQKNIYDNVRHGIIRGAAGTGKTLLILFKIIDLVQSHDNRKITLLAPHPHTLRCKNILEANGVRVVESEKIPPVTETIHDVVIMDIRNIQSVLLPPLPMFSNRHLFIDDFQSSFERNGDKFLKDVIMRIRNIRSVSSSPLPMPSNHHLFFDDFQSSFGDDRNDDKLHIGVKLKRAYEIATQYNLYLWCMDDSLQQTSLQAGVDEKLQQFYEDMFSTKVDDPTVPTYTLENILRNTQEISNVVLDERERVRFLTNVSSVDAHSSHNIKSTLPTLHQLDGWHVDNDIRVDFSVERLEEELRPFVGTTNPMPLSNIAVLCDDRLPSKDKLLKKTREMLLTIFNIIPMTIEQQLKSGSPTIVFDYVCNATSGEWPVVIYVADNANNSSYVAWSRARTQLIMIDIDGFNATILPHIARIRWRWENNKFVRASDNSP